MPRRCKTRSSRAGAVFQLCFGARYRVVTALAYVFVGWLIVVALEPLVASVPRGGLWLLLAGAISYTVGLVFHLWERLRYHHAVWRAFVLAGSTCHLLSVLISLPSAAS